VVQFQRCLSALIISENKTVEGINRVFVIESRHQSSLNHPLTASPLTLEEFAKQLKQKHLQAVAAGGKPVFHKTGITSPADHNLDEVDITSPDLSFSQPVSSPA